MLKKWVSVTTSNSHNIYSEFIQRLLKQTNKKCAVYIGKTGGTITLLIQAWSGFPKSILSLSTS